MGEPARHLSLDDLPALLAEAIREAVSPPERALSIRDVCERVGCGVTKVYEMEAQGRFPRRRKIDGKTVWLESEVSRWLRGLPEGG